MFIFYFQESQTYRSWCTEWEVESDSENSEQMLTRERKPQATDTTVADPVWVQVIPTSTEIGMFLSIESFQRR